ncbi:MAG TPA: SBBP repeat-containing protein, partial [Pyrinomonadaceae bacterium]|nr:SBBP repeat-containing protein [Pyrinomonadaceae bacterium]
MRARLAFALLLAAALLSGAAALDFTRGARAREDGPAAAAAPAGRAARLKALDDYGRAPMGFEANTGQVEGPVDFVAQGIGYTLFLTPSEAVFALRSAETKPDGKKAAATAGDARAEHPVAAEGAGYRVLRMKLVGASAPSAVSGEGIQPGRRNYFVGGDPARWRTNVPVYSKARYAGVYRGVDLVYYGNQRQLEYDFEVAPGADARPIRLKFEGADAAKIDDESGDLLLTLAGAELVMRRPFIYQPGEGGGRREVEGRYTLRGRNSVGFEVGSYDRTKPLIIDPVLNYSTYLGTSSADYTNGIAVDSAGNAYVTGATDSLSFPTTGQTFVSPNSFFGQAFVTKLNPAGTALAYSTVVGGSDSDGANAIAVDSSGAAYVTGRTYSRDFPLVAPLKSKGPFFRTANSAASWDNRATGFEPHVQIVQSVAVSPSSPSILYAGGSGGLHKSTDGGATWQKLAAAGVTFPTFGTLAVHPSNPSVIYTANNNATFRSTDGGATFAEVPLSAFGAAARCVEFDPTNSSVIYLCISSGVYKSTDDGATWSLLNSGLTNSNVLSLAVDPQTTTTLYAGTFGGGVFKSTNGGASWSPANNGVSPLSTRNVSAIAVDPSSPSTLYFGTSYATGSGEIYKSTDGAGLWAPLTNGVPKDNGISDIVINRTTTSTIYAATTGGGVLKTTNGGDSWAPANAGLWNPVVTSLAADPTDSSKLYAGTQGGARTESDAFALKLSPAGDALAYSTYVGGSADDEGRAVAVDSAGNAYLSGQTSSGNFPLASPVQSELRGPADAFVTKINAAGDAYVFSTYFGGAGLDGARAVATDSAGNAYAAGNTSSSDLQTTPGAFQTTAPGAGFTTSLNEGADAFVLKVAAAGSGVAYATYLGGAQGGEGANGIAVDSAGSAHVVGSTSSNNFPAQNPLRPFGGADGYIAKLNAAGSALVYSSPLGGSGDDAAAAVALDAAGAAHVTGWTRSLDFPSTGGHLKSRSNLFRSVDAAATWRNDNNGVSAALVFDIEVDPTAPHVIYVGTSSGVFKSTNGGRAWSPSNNGLANRNVRFIAVNPKSPSTVYAGTIFDGSNQGGLYKSTDGGASWAKTPSTASNGESFFDVYALALDPATPDTIYLHSGFRTFKSTTGGASWDGANNGLPGGATSFAVDPSNTQVVYASVNTSEGGVFKTTDGGANWSKTSNGLTTTFVHRVVVSPQTPSTVYATSI